MNESGIGGWLIEVMKLASISTGIPIPIYVVMTHRFAVTSLRNNLLQRGSFSLASDASYLQYQISSGLATSAKSDDLEKRKNYKENPVTELA